MILYCHDFWRRSCSKAVIPVRYRLLALDVDGTLLD